jgi:hypothetical protein
VVVKYRNTKTVIHGLRMEETTPKKMDPLPLKKYEELTPLKNELKQIVFPLLKFPLHFISDKQKLALMTTSN